MDKIIEILLGGEKNIASVNVDTYDKIELLNNVRELTEYDVNDAISSTDVFDAEREANKIYGIYGRIEWISMLNGLKADYKTLQDFFLPQYVSTSKNITNSFDFYLVRPFTGYTKLSGADSQYARYFQVIATPNDFELFNAGFSNNVYGEQISAFNFKKDIDVSQYFDDFGFPVTELYIYAQYIKRQNGLSPTNYETMKYTKIQSATSLIKEEFQSTNLNIGDVVKTTTGDKIGDLIEYSAENFLQTQISEQIFYIGVKYEHPTYGLQEMIWKYKPFIPLRLRYFANELNQVNTGTTSYDDLMSIPAYATKIDDNGNYVWRDILLQGYIDPLTGIGVNYPFVNGRRYLFSPIVLSVIPDMNDSYTATAFQNMWFSKNVKIKKVKPKSDLNNIGKPCQG